MISLENINDKLREYQIPDYMREDVRAYLFERQPMGSFLEAVFQNDLAEAFRTADETNRRSLWHYANFIHNELPGRTYGPGICPWGSVENVKAWVSKEGFEGHFSNE